MYEQQIKNAQKANRRKLLRDGIDSFGEAVKASKWIAVAFDIHGKSYRGANLFNTEDDCRKHIAKIEAEHAAWSYGEYRVSTPDGTMLSSEYSYAIPMPVQS